MILDTKNLIHSTKVNIWSTITEKVGLLISSDEVSEEAVNIALSSWRKTATAKHNA